MLADHSLSRAPQVGVHWLIALYENRTIAMAALLGLNSFDQWGVELGKELATRIGDRLTNRDGTQDPSATEFLRRYRSLREG